MAELTESDIQQLRERLGPLQIEGLSPLTGGASSLTYAGRSDRKRVVVKVAPAGVPPIGHRDVLRQCRIIRALGPTPVPVPDVLWEDAANPPLFVMSRLDGDSLEPLFDLDSGDTAKHPVAERFRGAAATMAELHRLQPAVLGLENEPVVGAEAEIERWCRALETVDPELVPGWRDAGAMLRNSLPAPMVPAVVHGDFRLGNLLAVEGSISGVIDWEIWSVGDPRIDAGWFLINSDPQTYRRQTPYVGMTPSPAELADSYQTALGRPVADLDWFQALACFKSVATWSLIVKHNRRRAQPDADLEAMSNTLPHLLSRVRSLLARER